MAKTTTSYECSTCGHKALRYFGKCASCGNFSTAVEVENTTVSEKRERAGLKSSSAVRPTQKAQTISALNKTPIKRTPTGISEFDRVLGGGFVDAEVVLFAGQPGAGKSTASLAVANCFALMGKKVLYSSGEESEQQIGLRASRMGVNSDNILIINETNLEVLLGHIEEETPDFIVVDSLQTLASSEIPGSAGSIQQSKEAAHTLTRLAKKQGITMLLISQVIKSGDFSGSEAIQHIVDCALMLESDNDTPLKFLRATKNRFGDTTEVGVFQHTERGLEEVTDPSGIFLEDNDEPMMGASCSFISEGVRQIPVEIQALVAKSTLPTPRKQFNGIQFQRGQIVCAILDKFCAAKLYEHDAFISTVSGIKVFDPQADLSIAASLLSSGKDKPISNDTVFIGELSLTGHVRGSFMIDSKLKEAERLGFTTAVIPAVAKHSYKPRNGMKIITIKNVKELLRLL